MISLVKKDYDSTKIYRKTHKKGASQTYDTPSCLILNTFAVSRLKLEVQIFIKFSWKKESNNPSIVIKLLSQKK